jgi:hypothetical protein
MPMPVSATASVIQSRPASGDGNTALLGELVGVTRQVKQGLPEADLIGMHRTEVRRALDDDPIAILRRHRLDGLGHVLDHGRQRERFKMKLHAPRLYLGEVEDVVDQGKQVPARTQHAIERFEVLIEALRILAQHLGDADDGVEWRAELMAHVGEEARFGPVGFVSGIARGGELPALDLDLGK